MTADAPPAEPARPVPPAGARRRRPWRFLGRALVLLYFVVGLVFLAVRYGVLPQIDRWREPIAREASTALGVPVRIGRIDADWSGLRPRLHLHEVRIGTQEAAGLRLDQVDATLAWTSLLRLRPYFHRLEIARPEVHLARSPEGRFSIGGIAVSQNGAGDSGALRWLLDQRQIVVRDATLTWSDALRDAPAFALHQVNLRIASHFGRHEAGLTAHGDGRVFEAVDLRAMITDAGLSPGAAGPTGATYLHLSGADLAAAAPWVDLPMALAGQGDLTAWVDLVDAQAVAGQAQFDVHDAAIRLAGDLPRLALARLSGHVAVDGRGDAWSVDAHPLTLRTGDGVEIPPTEVSLRLDRADPGAGGQLSATRIDLGAVAALAAYLPLPPEARGRLAAFSPRGTLTGLETHWRRSDGGDVQWSLKSGVEGLEWQAVEAVPGLAGVTGQVEGNQDGGHYRLASGSLRLTLPDVLTAPLSFERLDAEGRWTREAAGMRVALERAAFANPDLDGTAQGNYLITPDGPGQIDLQAQLSEADGAAVWRYMPKVVNDDTRQWLQRGIVAGRARDARLRLQGDLAHFPFADGSGTFLITAQVDEATLDYAPGWPRITEIAGALRFDGPRMTITASRGTISGVRLREVVADVPDLAHGDEQMTITGKAQGATRDFLRFVADSPVSGRINHFTDTIVADGDGRLDLRLDMPLRHVAATAVKGRFAFGDNRLTLVPGLPPVSSASGQVDFTGESLAIDKAGGVALGGPVSVSATTGKDGVVRFNADGRIHADALRQTYGLALLDRVSGQTPWHLSAEMLKGRTNLRIESSLEGIGSSLPTPLNKTAGTAWPLSVRLRFDEGKAVQVDGTLGSVAALALQIPRGNGASRISGGIGVGVAPRMADDGLMLAWQQPVIDLDAWLDALGESPFGADDGGGIVAGLSVSAERIELRDQLLHDVRLRAQRKASAWEAEIRAKEARGTITWLPAGEGRLVARLDRLMLARSQVLVEGNFPDRPSTSLPALDIVAEQFGVRGLSLGRLELQAFNRDGVWHMNTLTLANPDGELKGSGTWQPRGTGRTELDFELNTADVGALLGRLEYPDAVRGGTASLKGHVGWRGGPADLDYASMAGQMDLLAESGQFRKLDPGVGRLLGVLSLQSLPRRISLDFRDVFSEGFAFDRISGSIEMEKGVLSTDSLDIRGPAARVSMRGEASVPAETQNLEVTVQPTLSESVAVGAALGGAVVNPVAGVVTYIVQKALEDPVEKFFAYDYAITGTWDDPVVEKLGERSPPEQNGTSRGGR